MALRNRMAEFGFESNEDYEFQLRCLFAAKGTQLRCLNVAGHEGRRKTAFADALAHALEYPRVVYYDFTAPEPPPPPIVVSSEPDAEHAEPTEEPLSAFERAIAEACAYSEAERTFLILDQLQAAEFRDQIRLYQFVNGGDWNVGSASVRANAKNLVVALISETPLYHSLARVSFRVWTDASGGRFAFRPEDFGLGLDARELFAALASLFDALGSVPTSTELSRMLALMLEQVRTPEQLRHVLYGCMEHLDYELLIAPANAAAIDAVVHALNAYIGLDEVELKSP